jgi:hypothetical protein
MNSAIVVRFLTPYISSVTRDQDYLHSPLPLDGALAHAAYWEALTTGQVERSPTQGEADRDLMHDHVNPVLNRVLGRVALGDSELLDDPQLNEKIYLMSSGYPIKDGQLFIKQGAAWINLQSDTNLSIDREIQPIRKRVPVDRMKMLDLEWVGERGNPLTREPETGKGTLKAIDNRVSLWKIYEYTWFAQVLDRERLTSLLQILQYEGLGKKRTTGFGKILDYRIVDLDAMFPDVQIKRHFFVQQGDELILTRPLPYDAIIRAQSRIVMTNLIVESGCGYTPPYWSNRCVVVREGTLFRFLT